MDFSLCSVVLFIFCLMPSCYSVSDLVNDGCSQYEYNRYTCVYELYCVRQIQYQWNTFNTLCDRDSHYDTIEPIYNEYGDPNRPRTTATVHLSLKNYQYPNMIMESDRELAAIISLLDLSSNSYFNFPSFISMNKLKALNISRNFLTEAKLYNVNEFPILSEIDLSHNKITVIKVERNQYIYRNLRSINLSHNNLIIIEDGIFNFFFDLEHLDLSYNFIQHFNVMTFEGISNLKHFSLKHNSLNELDNFLFRFNKLTELDLSENNIQKIVIADMDKLIDLKILDLSSNFIMKVDENMFGKTLLLETLNFQNNLLQQLGKNMFLNNTKLKDINLSKNRLTSLPKDLFKNKRIVEFSITENKLQGALLKGSFEGLKLVSKLDLSSQLLTSVEDYAFYGLENLNTLLLNENKLQIITKTSFKTLRSLEVLDLSSNLLTNVEFDKDDLISLRKLLLQKNLLVQIKHAFFYGLNNLQFLDLSKNNISKLDMNSFKSLKDLVNFQISNNPINGSLEGGTFDGLNSLPCLDISGTLLNIIKNGSFNGMTQLKEFNASRCKISELQYNLFLHTGLLKTIDLSFNELTEFNINTTELVNLNRLILNNNLLTKISYSFLSGMPHLVNVIISHNEIKTIDEKAFENHNDIQYLDLSYNLNLLFNIVQLEKMQSLINVILSGIFTNITFKDIKEMKLTHLEMSESNICNATHVRLNKLKSLKHLILSKNNLTTVEASAFNGMQSLEQIDLSLNNIHFIQPGAFKDNTLLYSLNISHNMLTSVSYGIFRGLIHLDILDISYNEINDFKSERFYELPSLSVLIVDHNKISNLEEDYFAGTNLVKLSIGENPLPCHVLVKLDKVEKDFIVTAINLAESSNDENLHGVTCNKDMHINKQYEDGKVPAENILLDIRSILSNLSSNKLSEKPLAPTTRNDVQFLIDLKSQIEKINLNLNVSNKIYSLLFNNLSSNFKESSNNNSLLVSNTNLLLSKILKAYDTMIAAIAGTNKTINEISVSPATVEISDEKKTANYFMTYVNKIKQDLEDTIAAEKVNILKEIEFRITSKIPFAVTDRATFISTVKPTQEAYSYKANNSNLFLEVCVGLILVILLALILFKMYQSGKFIPNRHTSSTRHLSDVIAL